MKRRVAWATLAAVGALSLGCAPEARVSVTAYQQARLSFEPMSAAGAAPTANTGRSPDATVPASPPAGGASPAGPAAGGGGRGGEGAIVRGRVYGFDGTREAPLAGATVSTGDGRTATTDAGGRFSMAGGWPDNGMWRAQHPGYRASTIVGHPGGEVDLHLKTAVLYPGTITPPTGSHFDVAGRVVDEGGQPVEGLGLILVANDGSFGSAAATDAEGRFVMRVFSPDNVVTQASVVAVDNGAQAWLGAATGLAVASGTPELDFAPFTGGTDALVVRPTTHALDVAVDDGGENLYTKVLLNMALAGTDERFLIYGDAASVRLAELPGVEYGLEVEASDPDRLRQSHFVRDTLDVDFAVGHSVLAVPLLAPPTLLSWPGPEATEVSWTPVDQAVGYEVRLDSVDKRGPEWEAFTAGTSLLFDLSAPRPSGRYDVQVVAWDDPAMNARRVASASRPLRLLPVSGAYRWASTKRQVTF